MARSFPWLRFWSDMHGKGKIAALSDAEFRLLTRLWALGRQSETPGVVYVAPGVGWAPEDLAKTAGCKSKEKPEAMLKRLEKLTCIRVRPDGVIEVHDWEEHNPPVSPSKTPVARAQQKRKERAGGRQPVARRHDGDTEATGQQVAKPDQEEDQETDQEQEIVSERSTASPAPARPQRAGGEGTKLGPLGTAVRAECSRGLGYSLTPCDQARADRLEQLVEWFGGITAAVDYVAATCRKRDVKPQSLSLVVDMLADAAGQGAPA